MNTVTSQDGTRIVYDKTGSGPSVILVDGAFCSRNFGPMPKIAALLSEGFTVFKYDRRARGDSGDTKPYTIGREIEDIKALMDVAEGTVNLLGISSGAILCMHAAAAGLNINRLALFEPPFVKKYRKAPTENFVKPLNEFITQGKKGDAVKFYLRSVIGVPLIVPFILRLTPNWAKMKANAASLPYDATLVGDFSIPLSLATSIRQPTVVISSSGSPESLRKPSEDLSRSLSSGSHLSLKGGVHDVPAKVLVPALRSFYLTPNPS